MALVRPAAAGPLVLNREMALSGTAQNHKPRPRAAATSAHSHPLQQHSALTRRVAAWNVTALGCGPLVEDPE